jgi:ribosomal protein S6--L-glutamate ligase
MFIGLLSRSIQLYSTRALFRAAQARGHRVRVFDYMACDILLEDNKPKLVYGTEEIPAFDACIPRIGSPYTFHGVSVVRQFERMGITTAVSSEAILRSRDKLMCSQYLANEGIGIPKTYFSDSIINPEAVIDMMGGTPLIIKLLEGTHGVGVVLAENRKTAETIIETFSKTEQKFVVQEFIKEAKGADIRAFVVDGEVVAAMRRSAMNGDFRSNLHRGGHAEAISLTAEEEATAIKACNILGLKIGGVDMLQSNRGPLILEVNASPGLEGITNYTKIDVAGKIIDYLEKVHSKKNIPNQSNS